MSLSDINYGTKIALTENNKMKPNFPKLTTELSKQLNRTSVFKIPYFVLTISLIVTFFVTYFYYSSAKNIDQERFIVQTNKIKTEIENRLETYVALLRAARGYFNASEEVTKDQFRDFVQNINLRTFYPGVLAIGYSKVFKPEEKDELIAKMQKQGFTDFKLKPDTARDEYQAIIFIEPLEDRNRVALGFDMSSENIRKTALEKAKITGTFAKSGKVLLIQENEINQQAGFLIYVPVYKTKFIPENLEERNAQIDGFVYSPFRAGEFIQDVINQGRINDIVFKIYDNNIDESNLLTIGNESQKIPQYPLQTQNELEFGQRKWIVSYTSTESFNQQSLVWWTPIICILGLLISIILFFLSLSQSRTNQNLITTANELASSANLIGDLLQREKNARESAEKSARVKDEFLATVSHELRTPLNIISGWINILKIGGLDNQTNEKAFDTISKNLNSQANLVEQMLIFSDKESIINIDKFQLISLNNTLDECLTDSDSEFSQKNLTLTKILSATEFTVSGDKEKLKQAIKYLINNSIKFSSENETVTISTFEENEQAVIEIRDTGEGISAEMLPRIFEGFSQTDSSSVRKYGGIGLGLAIAKKIIEAHQGSITVASKGLGEGAVFKINLPIYKKEL